VGVVSSVVDGDTIRVEIEGLEYSVRYIGINTPEQGEPFAYEATLLNSDLVAGQTVTLVKDVSETDQFGRLLRYVLVGNVFVNDELVGSGLAFADTFPPDVACADRFVASQQTAFASSLGVWVPIQQSAATSPPGQGDGCHPSYPTVCIPPSPPDLDCGDIAFRRFSVVGSDPHNFDGDGDGVGCESG
jgi:micrococcal nuclease